MLPRFNRALGTATALSVNLTGTEIISGNHGNNAQAGVVLFLSYGYYTPPGPFTTYTINPVLATSTVHLVGTVEGPPDLGLTTALNNGSFYSVFEFSSVNFTSQPTFSIPGELSGTVSYTYTPMTSPIPEPSSLALLGTGLLSVVGLARRRFQEK